MLHLAQVFFFLGKQFLQVLLLGLSRSWERTLEHRPWDDLTSEHLVHKLEFKLMWHDGSDDGLRGHSLDSDGQSLVLVGDALDDFLETEDLLVDGSLLGREVFRVGLWQVLELSLQFVDSELGGSDHLDVVGGLLGQLLDNFGLNLGQLSEVLLLRGKRNIDLVLKLSDSLLQVDDLGSCLHKHGVVTLDSFELLLDQNGAGWLFSLDSGDLGSDDVDILDPADDSVSQGSDDLFLNHSSWSLLLAHDLVCHDGVDVLVQPVNSFGSGFVQSLEISDSLDDGRLLLWFDGGEKHLELGDLLLGNRDSSLVAHNVLLESVD